MILKLLLLLFSIMLITRVEDGKLPIFNGGGSVKEDAGLVSPSSSTAGVYGAWVQAVADVGSLDIYLFTIALREQTANTIQGVLSIGIGASASEVELATVPFMFTAGQNISVIIPIGGLRIPANSRLAVRILDDSATAYAYNCNLGYLNA